MAADTGSTTVTPVAAAPASAAIIRSPMDKHGMQFVPRAQVQDYKDRLYHGKPEYNYKGIAYKPPNPQKIHRLHTLAIMPKQPVSDSLLRDLARNFFAVTGLKPSFCAYPGTGNRRWRGITAEGPGQVMLELIPMPGDFEPYMGAAT